MYIITLESPLALLHSIALLVHENYIMFETKQVGEHKSQNTLSQIPLNDFSSRCVFSCMQCSFVVEQIVSASHARLFRAVGVCPGREGPETNERSSLSNLGPGTKHGCHVRRALTKGRGCRERR